MSTTSLPLPTSAPTSTASFAAAPAVVTPASTTQPPTNYYNKYAKLSEKYNAYVQQRDQLINKLEHTRKRIKSLKLENSDILDLIIYSRPHLAQVSLRGGDYDLSDGEYKRRKKAGLLSVPSMHSISSGSERDEPLEDERQLNPDGTYRDDSENEFVKAERKRLKKRIMGSILNKKTGRKLSKAEPTGLDTADVSEAEPTAEPVKKRTRRGGKRDTRTDAKVAKNLPKDQNGNLIVPVTVGKSGNEVTIESLGKVVYDREGFHSGRYIWPAGFVSKKTYLSLVELGRRTIYTNKIIDTGAEVPVAMTADDMPGVVYTASSASGVWKKLLLEMSAKGVVGPKTHVSGPEFFGLSDLGIIKAIQELPGANLCSRYIMQVWVDNSIKSETATVKDEDEDEIEDEED